MRAIAAIAVLSIVPLLSTAADKKPAADKVTAEKLTLEDRIELTRGLVAEYGTVKVLLPRSKKALEFNSDGTYDKRGWSEIAKESGPAARSGDTIQVTKIILEHDRIVLELNGGFKGGRKWYQGVQVGGGMGGATTAPISTNSDSNAPGGTSLAVLFHKPLEAIKASEVKKMLAPVLDFEKHTVTEIYSETLAPEMQKAIKEKRVTEGMNHEQVVMTLGRPRLHERTTKDGMDLEDWIYGQAPGKITFVTFNGDKVIKVKEAYAGLGTQVQDPVVK
jgi:hypothetical protein